MKLVGLTDTTSAKQGIGHVEATPPLIPPSIRMVSVQFKGFIAYFGELTALYVCLAALKTTRLHLESRVAAFKGGSAIQKAPTLFMPSPHRHPQYAKTNICAC